MTTVDIIDAARSERLAEYDSFLRAKATVPCR